MGGVSHWTNPQGVPSPFNDGADGIVGNIYAASTDVAGTISRYAWFITVADNRTEATADGPLSHWGFKNIRHKRFAATGRGTIPDTRACSAAAAATTTVANHAVDSATNGVRVMPTAASIKGAASTFDTTSPSHIGARIDPADDNVTTASYLSPARPPLASSPSQSPLPPPPPSPPTPALPTDDHPSTAAPLLTPGIIVALETSSQAAVRTVQQLAPPRSSRPTYTRTPEGGVSAPAPTPELPPSPPHHLRRPQKNSSGRKPRKTAMYATRAWPLRWYF